ncbi:uncharacterized protein SAPINGB_P000973 [Magnusiomyces paraingens]|uniref:diphosphoinositol-polyphosphate diphosphatase n=1 Tax=Magnusiomyces paraingens TaxID=2606893 RepID=A0A5E8B538_9ASCO|nr:uncharacterized protein SAPINGB_P000973 [Saprochaete ingens]VVT45952.1 unnamed protein product [Saprochaete ingens]
MTISSSSFSPKPPGEDSSNKSLDLSQPQESLIQQQQLLETTSSAEHTTLHASPSNDPYTASSTPDNNMASTLRTLTEQTHQFYMSPRTAVGVSETEQESFSTNPPKMPAILKINNNSPAASFRNSPDIMEEEEEDDDEDGMGNESGYADGQDIDERTERPLSEEVQNLAHRHHHHHHHHHHTDDELPTEPNELNELTRFSSAVDLLSASDDEDLLSRGKLDELQALCKQVFSGAAEVHRLYGIVSGIKPLQIITPSDSEIRSLVDSYVFDNVPEGTDLDDDLEEDESSTRVAQCMSVLRAQLLLESEYLQAVAAQLQDPARKATFNAATAAAPLATILCGDSHTKEPLVYYPAALQQAPPPPSLSPPIATQEPVAETSEQSGYPVFSHVRISHEDMLPAPENFSMVVNGIYRSSFPRADCFEFLKKIKLKSILVLIPEQYPDENVEFLKSQGIQFFQVGMPGNKEPFVHVPHSTITQALEIAINPANHPVLIHCNRGKHRTGCVVGCIRRLQNWSLTMIFDEYRRFAFPKARPLDQQLIELYNDHEIYSSATEQGWLPLQW